jgi:hypothetical protein
MPPHGSGIGVWVAVDKLEDDAGVPLLIVVKADLETPSLGAGVGVLETATVWGARASPLWPAKAMGGTVSADILLIYKVEEEATHLLCGYHCSDRGWGRLGDQYLHTYVTGICVDEKATYLRDHGYRHSVRCQG